MSDSSLLDDGERALKFQARDEVAKGIRKNCPDSDPMTTNITVMLGTIMAMAVFSAILYGGTKGRGRKSFNASVYAIQTAERAAVVGEDVYPRKNAESASAK